MANHLNNRDINAIVNLIRGWQEPKLSWSAICEAAEPLVGKLPSRQSLNAHEAIVTAYQTKKGALKGRGPKNPRPAAARIVNLESEIEELKEENRRYKQQFVIWQYNAYKHGMTEHQLNTQLTKIDRERSDGERR